MEDIREVAYKGDLQTLRHLIEHLGIKVGDKHSINGTTRSSLTFLSSFPA